LGLWDERRCPTLNRISDQGAIDNLRFPPSMPLAKARQSSAPKRFHSQRLVFHILAPIMGN
jgi:hypothetical protein